MCVFAFHWAPDLGALTRGPRPGGPNRVALTGGSPDKEALAGGLRPGGPGWGGQGVLVKG